MGLRYNDYLSGDKIYGCKNCKTHLANHEDIISRVRFFPFSLRSHVFPVLLDAVPVETRTNEENQNFRGQHGKAYLFHTVVNIESGDPAERNMTTGRHVVRDITCRQCKETVGWKYDKAYETSEKYKEGKFILEADILCNVT